MITAASVRSKWCLPEIGAALALRKPIVSALIDGTKLPDVLKSIQAVLAKTAKQRGDLLLLLKEMCAS